MSTLRLGIIGLGRFCTGYHIRNLLDRDDVEIPAVCDTSPERLTTRHERLQGAAEYSDFCELLQPDRIDGVIVSTPNLYHFEQCRLALERGMHVLVDKPLTMTASQAAELVDLARQQGLLLMTAFTRHFMAGVEHVRQQIASGKAGALQMITAVQRGYGVADPHAMGGLFHCRSVHIFDLCPWLTGRRVVSAEGRVELGEDGYESLVDVRLELERGATARLFSTRESDGYQDEVSIYGADQSFRIEKRLLYRCEVNGAWSLVEDLPDCGNSTAHFVDSLLGLAPAPGEPAADPHGEDGLRSLQVLEAVVEAGRTGRCIEVPQ